MVPSLSHVLQLYVLWGNNDQQQQLAAWKYM